MKRITKITLRTKIHLTIAGLLSLVAGTVYGAGAFFFAPLNQATGIAISPSTLYATQFCGQGLFGFDCAGNQSLLGIIPLGPEQCMEKYLTIAPIQSAAAGFTPTDVFISEGPFLFKFTPPAGPVTFFAAIPPGNSCTFSDHSSVKFDKVGTFGFKLTMTCEGGDVYTVDSVGIPTFVGTFAFLGHDPVHIEGQEVAAATFGPLGGKLLVTDENTKTINAMDNLGNVTFNVFNWAGDFGKGVENVRNIPANLGTCSFGCIQNQPIGTFFQQVEDFGFTLYYPPTDFTTGGLNDGKHVLVTTEADPPNTTNGTILVAFNPITNSYDTSIFDPVFNFTINEGAQFVDCDAVTPTPTPTATPTFTPTPSATFTPTPTATFTPTPTATFTPTATATFTPTATATFTPTATATFTPTPTATATSTPTPTPTPTPQGHVSQITPTGTTCNEFKNGTADTLTSLLYSVKNGQINQVAPGVFFYWVKVTAVAGNNVFTITETSTPSFRPFGLANGGNNVFDLSCNAQSETITQNPTTGTVTVSFNAPVAATYIISLKYDSGSVKGAPAPSPTTVHYDFATTGVPGSTSGLDLAKN